MYTTRWQILSRLQWTIKKSKVYANQLRVSCRKRFHPQHLEVFKLMLRKLVLVICKDSIIFIIFKHKGKRWNSWAHPQWYCVEYLPSCWKYFNLLHTNQWTLFYTIFQPLSSLSHTQNPKNNFPFNSCAHFKLFWPL